MWRYGIRVGRHKTFTYPEAPRLLTALSLQHGRDTDKIIIHNPFDYLLLDTRNENDFPATRPDNYPRLYVSN